ncbi:LysM peptidoglycan-binding domain-containing protein [Cetobacterium sp.]|uniref:LysM peptidoglycan-binding domain-containing protein n=1 Tax=Cetobacterium sp. TaxID=2071632 RepID=UPI003F3C5833
MKKIILLFLLKITFSLANSKTSLKFEVLEKNNTNIRILIKSDKNIAIKKSTPTSTIYIVKYGDTLSRISKKFNVSLDNLKKLNSIKNENLITVNQKLVIK